MGSTIAAGEVIWLVLALIAAWAHASNLYAVYGPLPDPGRCRAAREVLVMFRVSETLRLAEKLVWATGALYALGQPTPTLDTPERLIELWLWRGGTIAILTILVIESFWSRARRRRLDLLLEESGEGCGR